MVDKKELIRTAAVQIFAEEGFHRATTDKIAAAAGIAVGTVYNYFSSKEEILSYICETEYEKRATLSARLRDEGANPFEQIAEIIARHFQEVSENPGLIKVILVEKRLAKKSHGLGVEPGNCGLWSFIKDILDTGIRKGQIRDCDTGLVAALVFGMIEAAMVIYLSDLSENNNSAVLMNAQQEILRLLKEGVAKH